MVRPYSCIRVISSAPRPPPLDTAAAPQTAPRSPAGTRVQIQLSICITARIGGTDTRVSDAQYLSASRISDGILPSNIACILKTQGSSSAPQPSSACARPRPCHRTRAACCRRVRCARVVAHQPSHGSAL